MANACSAQEAPGAHIQWWMPCFILNFIKDCPHHVGKILIRLTFQRLLAQVVRSISSNCCSSATVYGFSGVDQSAGSSGNDRHSGLQINMNSTSLCRQHACGISPNREDLISHRRVHHIQTVLNRLECEEEWEELKIAPCEETVESRYLWENCLFKILIDSLLRCLS